MSDDKSKTVGLYISPTFSIGFNAKKDKAGKVTQEAVSHSVERSDLMARVKMNGHSLEDVATDYLCKMIEKGAKKSFEWTHKTKFAQMQKDLDTFTLEVRTPSIETLDLDALIEDHPEFANLPREQVIAFAKILKPNLVIVTS